jgi:phage baseplate assembly protein W
VALVARRDYSTETVKQRIIYSDVNSSFTFNDTTKNDITNIVNEESVKESIRNILFTNRGERFFNPSFGSDLKHILFELSSPATEKVLEDLITTAINNYEPRANVLDVSVSSEEDQHFITATIIFSVINREQPIVFDLILNRIR